MLPSPIIQYCAMPDVEHCPSWLNFAQIMDAAVEGADAEQPILRLIMTLLCLAEHQHT
jgi:hypothetical protein